MILIETSRNAPETTKTVKVLRDELTVGADWDTDPSAPWYTVTRIVESIQEGQYGQYTNTSITTISKHDTREEAEAALANIQK